MTRARALALGATHEAVHFGVRHWVWMQGDDLDTMEACPRCGWLEPWITLCCHAHAFINGFRAPQDQCDFAFLIKPLDRAVGA